MRSWDEVEPEARAWAEEAKGRPVVITGMEGDAARTERLTQGRVRRTLRHEAEVEAVQWYRAGNYDAAQAAAAIATALRLGDVEASLDDISTNLPPG